MSFILQLNRNEDRSAARQAVPQIELSDSPVLVGDIGGTTTRFGLVYPDGQLRSISIVTNDIAATIEESIERYLSEHRAKPRAAVLAVAGLIEGDER